MCSTLVLCVRFHATFPPAELGPSSPHTRFRPALAHHPPKPPHTLAQHQPFPTSSTVCRPPQPGFTRSRHRPGQSPPPKTLSPLFFLLLFSVPDFSRFGNRRRGTCFADPDQIVPQSPTPTPTRVCRPAQPSPAQPLRLEPLPAAPAAPPPSESGRRDRQSPPLFQFNSHRREALYNRLPRWFVD